MYSKNELSNIMAIVKIYLIEGLSNFKSYLYCNTNKYYTHQTFLQNILMSVDSGLGLA